MYKKYIKRGDKLFGPYYYRSIKKDGKVITQYVKRPDDFPKKNSLFIANGFSAEDRSREKISPRSGPVSPTKPARARLPR